LDAEVFYNFLGHIGSYVGSVWNKSFVVIRSEFGFSDRAFGDSFGWFQIWEEEDWRQSQDSWSAYDCSRAFEWFVNFAGYGSLVVH